MKRKKRKRPSMTDAEILTLLLSGRYRVDVRNGKVFSDGERDHTKGRPLATSQCHRGYLHVVLHDTNRQRKIAVHKLVWMYANQQTVPDGFHVHLKKEGKRWKHINRISNLYLREWNEHGWYHTWAASKELRKRYPVYDEYRDYRKSLPVKDFLEGFD